MAGLHSHSKEQREAVRMLLKAVLVRDLGSFKPDQFIAWISQMDAQFRRAGLTLRFAIGSSRIVTFTIKEIRNRRTAFEFSASSRVQFKEDAVTVPDLT